MAYLAPAGTPVTLSDIAHGVAGAIRSSGVTADLTRALCQVTGLTQAWPLSSGRAAMTMILRAMQRCAGDHRRDQVIMPAYTCYSVPAAIERAGLKPRLCDVEPSTLGMDPEALTRCDFSRVLAVVSANLYGLPNDLVAIEAICRSRGVFLLDDAAQALGATFEGRAVGSFGDAGLYSFDKGKIISTMQGGAIASRPGELASQLESAGEQLPGSTLTERSGNIGKLVVYSVFLRPALYGLVRRLPFTALGRTEYETRYPMARLSAFQIAVAVRLIARLTQLNAQRRRRAAELDQAVADLPGVQIVRVLPGAQAVYARYPLRVRDREARNRVIAALDRAGIGATASYPRALADVPEVTRQVPSQDRACPGAREVAATIVTLPTHYYCPADYAARVRQVWSECLE